MPSTWSGRGWRLEIDDISISIQDRARSFAAFVDCSAEVKLARSWLRWFLYVDGARVLRLHGLRRAAANDLSLELRRFVLADPIRTAVAWDRQVRSAISTASQQQRWVPREQVDELVELQPPGDLVSKVRSAAVEPLLSSEEQRAVSALDLDIQNIFADLNEQTLRAELRDRREFFDRIEKSPLSEEQARAVVCFDSRVHLLAAAGSGKTSVMVARAAYAVARGFVRPERVLLLAFNQGAASELQNRVEEQFAAAGIPSAGVRASTFHAFGLDVIGRATGRKPRLAPWLDSGQDMKMMEQIVDKLRDVDKSFRFKWDLFRFMFASAPTDLDGGTPDAYDPSTRCSGFRTFNCEIVRSAGERMIADWLFVNGVNYEYERPFHVDVSDESHSQYHPDFYYPDVDVWHEHWGLDGNGEPRADFEGYAESMEWKKARHREHGTKFVESIWYDVMYGDGLERLQEDLTSHGLNFDWNPDREIPGDAKPLQFADLVRLVRTFMAHVKSNSLDETTVKARLKGDCQRLDGRRTQLFLDLYWSIHLQWDRELRGQNYVDFEDMLVLAADHLEAGNVDLDYELILVDEFQDVSQARARLVRGLLQRPGRFLLAVGDDWQAINRFAGADISVMMKFDDWFGASTQLELSTTFRCPQTICDVGSQFVMRNPRQFNKSVRSAKADPGPPVTLIRADDEKAGIALALDELSRSIARGSAGPGRNGKATVNVLGRYGFEIDLMPEEVPQNLEVAFRTVHSSKGLEADFIVIPRLVSGRFAFPSEIADDPVLDLAMAAPDDYPNAEERRLFYVALTRARHRVLLVTQRGKESPFVVELLRDKLIVSADGDSEGQTSLHVCDKCGEGLMVLRSGPYSEFLGCSRFPACTNKITPPEPNLKQLPRDPSRDPAANASSGGAVGVVRDEPGCRFCAETPNPKIKFCRHCGRDVSVARAPLAATAGIAPIENCERGNEGHKKRLGHQVEAPVRGRSRSALLSLLGLLVIAGLAALYSSDPSAFAPVNRFLQSSSPPRMEFAVEPAGTQLFVNTAVLNVRSGPSTEASIVAQLTSGQPVRQIDESGQWRQIAIGESSVAVGWVYAPLVSESPPH
jgi:DNA helicase-4